MSANASKAMKATAEPAMVSTVLGTVLQNYRKSIKNDHIVQVIMCVDYQNMSAVYM